MSATEVREKYGDLLKQGKLKEIQERIETQDTEEPAPANQDTDVCETFRRIAESFSRVSLNSILQQQPDMPEEARKLIKALMNREKIPDWHTIISAHKET